MEELKNEWYYRSGGTQLGPVPKEELQLMIGQGRLSMDDYVWKQGTPDWIKVRDSSELFNSLVTPPPFVANSPSNIEGLRAGVKIAAVLTFVMAVIWTLITLLQIFLAATVDESATRSLTAAWNLVFTVVSFATGFGLLKVKKWAYKWGMPAAVTGVIWYIVSMASGGSVFLLFFAAIELAIAILLFSNREIFKDHESLSI